LKRIIVIGIDLAGKTENPTGWAILEGRKVKTRLVYTDDDIFDGVCNAKPSIIAIDAPLAFPKREILRKADHEMIRRGYRVFPPVLSAMRMLTERAIKINKLITEKGYKTIEVHPTSTRKALNMPSKDWRKIQTILKDMGLKGDIETRSLTPHEIDAVTSALTAHLHIQNQTEAIGDEEEGYIIVPKRRDWRTLKI
jgi:predicted nuclease with RNAse H fold